MNGMIEDFRTTTCAAQMLAVKPQDSFMW